MLYVVKGCLDGLVVSATSILDLSISLLTRMTKGIYPTTIIIVIALQKTKVEQEFTLPTIESAGVTPLPQLPIQAAFATHTSETVDGDSHRDTVVLIGFPSPGNSNSFDLTSKHVSEAAMGTES